MVKCSNCGAWNNDNNNFCSNCANDLRMDNKTKTSYSKSQIKCPNCGTMNTNARFCGACGKAIWKYNTTKPSDQQIKKSLGRQLTALVLFIIFVCFLVKRFFGFLCISILSIPLFL